MKPARFVLLAALPVLAVAGVERVQLDFDTVRQLAATRAAAPYEENTSTPPRALAELSPAEIAQVRFLPANALWSADALPFRVQYLHPFADGRPPAGLHEFSATHTQDIPFVASFFDYGERRTPPRLPASLGYGGFRVLTALNRPQHFDELIVFPGDATFRALGAGQNFGLAARALSLDAGPLAAEEFPRLTDFWLGRPQGEATSVTIYALLDSPRAAGAYEFVVHPGTATVVDVRAAVTFRSTVALPGFAPLSGMFWYGENTDRPAGEPRPEVHEADGLAVRLADGSSYWRPLQNPTGRFGSGIAVEALRGFGLLQRDRNFEHYGDLDADYDRRPSVWVEPIGDWGSGRVQLVEAPAHGPFEANVTAFWVPDRLPAAGTPFVLTYRLHWTREEPAPARAPVEATHIGALAGKPLGRLFWIDFAGANIARTDNGALDADIQLGPGAKLLRQSVRKNPVDASWRVALEVEAMEPGRAVELRCRLREGYNPVSETWVYSWLP